MKFRYGEDHYWQRSIRLAKNENLIKWGVV